jgi:multidrug efflux system outer membrane protein
MKRNQLLPLSGSALSAVALCGLLLSGCSVGPNFKTPNTSLPSEFSENRYVKASGSPEVIAHWWTVFGDKELDALIDETAAANHDLRQAKARVREARALRGVETAAFFPTINADGSYGRSRLSENTPEGRQAIASRSDLEGELYTAKLDASWEIDVFGGTRRRAQAAQADLNAAKAEEANVLVSVLGETGLNYLELRGLQKQLAVAKSNLKTQRDTLSLTLDRAKAGLASNLDTARSEAQVASTEAQIPPIEEGIRRAIHRLGVLTGRTPEALESRLARTAPLPSAAPGVPVGLPSELLRRRPDIRQAEQQLAAATSRIGVAVADLFPKFYLTSAAGYQSIGTENLVTSNSQFWTLGPSVQWPIFAGGRIRQNIKVQDARQEEAAAKYEQTVLVALEEVENALVAYGKEQDRYRALAASEAASKRAVKLADERYKSGIEEFLNVLEAQRTLLTVQSELVQSEQRLGQNTVRLYKALGGGWAAPVPPPVVSPKTSADRTTTADQGVRVTI